MRAPDVLFAASFSSLMLASCASALREPPSVTEMAGRTAQRGAVSDVGRLLRQAGAAYAKLTLDSVREATRLWLAAAAADETRIEGLIGAVRGNVRLAGQEAKAQARDDAARSAVDAAQLCRKAAPEDPECDYWLAVAIGVQARERRSTALDGLPRMVKLLQAAADVDPGLEHGGPDRVLALVLLRAPGWPSGPGDPETGLEHARRAVALQPDYPPNQLCLAEALAENDEIEASRQAYSRAAVLAQRWMEAGEAQAAEWLTEAETGRPR